MAEKKYKEEIILLQKYNWESSVDAERDLSEAIEKLEEIYGDEWPGEIGIIVSYVREVK